MGFGTWLNGEHKFIGLKQRLNYSLNFHCRQLSFQEMDSLSHAHSLLKLNDHRKLQKWKIRARVKPLLDKGCSAMLP